MTKPVGLENQGGSGTGQAVTFLPVRLSGHVGKQLPPREAEERHTCVTDQSVRRLFLVPTERANTATREQRRGAL